MLLFIILAIVSFIIAQLIAIEKKQREIWSIGIYTMQVSPEQIKIIPHPKAHNPVLTAKDVRDCKAQFVADPFLVQKNGHYYLFFEVYSNKGAIGLAKSSDGITWNYGKIILEEPFHLSYPFVFQHVGQYYMIPESFQTNSIRLYKAINFPTSWVFIKTLISGKDFVDTTITFSENKWWLFTSTTNNADLYLYYTDTLEGPWFEHPKNPIVQGDIKRARCGGNILKLNGKLIRLAQDDFSYHNDPLCDYGNAVRALEIIKLSTTDYLEKERKESPLIFATGKRWNKDGMHHFSTCGTPDIEQLVCVDGKIMVNTYQLRLRMPRLIGKVLSDLSRTLKR